FPVDRKLRRTPPYPLRLAVFGEILLKAFDIGALFGVRRTDARHLGVRRFQFVDGFAIVLNRDGVDFGRFGVSRVEGSYAEYFLRIERFLASARLTRQRIDER